MAPHSHRMRSSLGQVRGLGSAKDGVQYWWLQRLSAVALVPLALWFAAGVVCHAGADHAAMTAWIAQPFTAIVMILLIVATFWHAALGLQVVLEDYVVSEGLRVASIALMKLTAAALAVAALFAVLKIAL